MDWEFAVLNFLQTIHTKIGDAFFSTITHLGDGGIFWILLTLLFLCIKKYRKYGMTMAFAMLFGVLIGNLTLKPLIARVRPYDVNTAIEILIKKPHDFSFPSGHTLASFAASISILWYNKKLGISAVIVAVLIAFSRMYLYVHYPTDVLAGAVIGIICSYASLKLVQYLRTKSKVKNFLGE